MTVNLEPLKIKNSKSFMYFLGKNMVNWNWSVATDEKWSERFSFEALFRHLTYGILDHSIPLCCIVQYSLDWFLTGDNQAKKRGLIHIRDYYQKYLGTAFVPCFFHKLLFISEKIMIKGLGSVPTLPVKVDWRTKYDWS